MAPQYEKLEELQFDYQDQGFSVLGFPSNQFLQELSSETAIKEYWSTTWGITFPMFERVRANGRAQHPLYAKLTKTPDSTGKAGRIIWSFEKFLISPSDEVRRFRPTTEPDASEVVSAIEGFLPWPSRPAGRGQTPLPDEGQRKSLIRPLWGSVGVMRLDVRLRRLPPRGEGRRHHAA